uniref:F-box domain-containing protein n=1 Tax=Plectus sambesii TaxID=2011161 RepID=A0A914VHI3_9BILA
MSMEAFEAEVARVQAENDRLRRTLADFSERIVCGRLTGDLPDNFLEQFNQLPDRPLEQVLRFLPPGQVAQMRLVSRKFNHLIRKCSKTMPKKEHNGSVLFKSNDAGQLTVELFDDRGSKITETMLTGNKVALSELLRLIRIAGLMFFGKGLSATSEVLDQLSKAWLAICPEVVVFAGDLSQTSRDSLRAFLVKVEPFIGRLHFQGASNIVKSLLDDDLIGAAGQLDGLMVQPYYCGWRSRSINIGDETLLAMADADDMPSYFFFMGCSGITPGGTRAFIEKWMNKWMKTGKPETSAKFTVDILRSDWDLLELIFYNCANVTPAAVEEACGDLLKKETTAVLFGSGMVDRVLYSIQCRSSNRRLEIFFHINPFRSHLVNEPRPGVALDLLVDDEWDSDMDHEYEDVDDEDDEDDFEAVATFEAEVGRVHAENDRLRRSLGDICGQIVCGRLKGKLPDDFLEQFSQLPDRPLEHVLRFLPPVQVVQMRLVSRKFNHLIRKCSKTMPKKERKGSVWFKSYYGRILSVVLFDDRGCKINETILASDEIALSELLRFICIKGLIYFGDGLSAADEVLDQLCKAWLTIRPEVVIFAGDLSQTSRDSLRAFLVKVEPSIKRLNFQHAKNIADSLLSDDLICAAGRLDGLMIKPWPWGSKLHNINISDETLLSMANANDTPSYFLVMGWSGITPGGIRAFVEKWMKNWRSTGKPKAGVKSTDYKLRSERNLFELTFYKCANVTHATVEAACGALLKKEWINEVDRSDLLMNSRMYIAIQSRSSNRRLEIHFDTESSHPHYVNEPRPNVALNDLIDDDWDSDMVDEDHDDEDNDLY